MERHLARCSHCRKELADLLAIKRLCADKQKPKLSDNFLGRLNARIEKEIGGENLERKIEAAGIFARRLIPVPLIIMLLLVVSLFRFHNTDNIFDNYIYGSLGGEEIRALSGGINAQDLLDELW